MPLDAGALARELAAAEGATLPRTTPAPADPLVRSIADGRGTVSVRWDRGEKRPAVLLHMDGVLVAAERFDVLNARARDRFAEHVLEDQRASLTAALLALGAQPAPVPEDTARPRASLIEHAEPWPDPVSLRETLDTLRAQLMRHAVLPPHAAEGVTLWCAGTHFLEVLDYFGVLHVQSPVRESGKTRLLELVALASARAWTVISPTPATLFRVIEASAPTVILDEADALSRELVAELVGLVNDGVRRGGCVPRAVEQPDGSFGVEGFAVYSPKAIGSIGVPFGDATVSRTIRVVMERATPDQLKALAPFRADHADRRWGRDLRRRLARAAADDGPRLAALLEAAADDPGAVPLPAGVDGRQAQVWEPLVALADVAGGDWPRLARAACGAFVRGLRAAEPADRKVQLLADLRSYFTLERPTAAWATSEMLIEYLMADESRGWREFRKGHPLTPHQLARLLKPFGLAPVPTRAPELPKGRARAWSREALAPVWERLAPPTESDGDTSPGSVTSVQSVASVPDAVTDVTLCTDDTLPGEGPPITFSPSAGFGPGLETLPDDYWSVLAPEAA